MGQTGSSRKNGRAVAVMVLAPIMGGGSLLLFTVFLFAGPRPLVDLHLPEWGRMIWNTLLSIIFFVQHSAMIRRTFRSWLATRIFAPYHQALFALVASLALILMFILWQPSCLVLLELQGLERILARTLFFLGCAGTVWGGLSLKGFDPFGRVRIRNHLTDRPETLPLFSIQGPYRWVRHPIYSFTLILIWSCPKLTADRLLFNLIWTLWIVLGTILEEKDLVADWGTEYSRYQDEVPMLIPWKIPGKKFRQ